MSRLILIFQFLVFGVCVGLSQQQATFIEPLCWRVSPSLDSTVHRITFVSAQSTSILEVGYINNNGIPITVPVSQELLQGACECCYGKFPPTTNDVIPSVEGSASQPTFNPFNPTVCGSTLSFQTVGVTNVADISVTLDGSPIPFAWDSMTGQGSASGTFTINSGIHTFVVTITTTNCNPCSASPTFDCG